MNTYNITNKDFTDIWRKLKASAKKRGIPFSITPSDLNDLGLPITCPVLGCPIHFHRGKQQWDSISYDRIDSNKGYEPGNLVVVSMKVNRIKSNYTIDEVEKVLNYYRSLSPE